MMGNKVVAIATISGITGAIMAVTASGILAFGLAAAPDLVSAVRPKVIVTTLDHGFKTERVIATRYKNSMLGYNIGFRYLLPGDDAKADSAEVADFFENQGCGIFQGGGSPFSEYFIVCKDVIDQTSANAKIQTLLPDLDRFIQALP